jgi:hypothetical protein
MIKQRFFGSDGLKMEAASAEFAQEKWLVRPIMFQMRPGMDAAGQAAHDLEEAWRLK